MTNQLGVLALGLVLVAGSLLVLSERRDWRPTMTTALLVAVAFLPALLLGLSTWRDRVRLLAGTTAVGLTLLLTMPVTVGTPARELPHIVSTIAGYSSAGGTWGWSSVVFAFHPYTYESFETSTFWAVIGRVGSIATLLAVAAAIWWWRRSHPVVIAGVAASVFQVTTAGHGAQYLLWPVPFTTLAPTRLQPLLQTAIGLWAWWLYVGLWSDVLPLPWSEWPYRLWPVTSLVLVALIVLALPWRLRQGVHSTARPAVREPVGTTATDR